MAYGRNQGAGQQRGQQGGGYSRGGPYSGGRGGSGGGRPTGGKPAGAKPDFRLAEMTEQDGKKVTVKDPTTGKTVYIGAMWSNPYGGFNVEIELDGQKIRARAFPTDDGGAPASQGTSGDRGGRGRADRGQQPGGQGRDANQDDDED